MSHEFWFASGNKGKINEFKLAFKELPDLKIHTQDEIPGFSPRPEDGKTFLENARIKARTLRAVRPGFWVMGEDSGLEVDGLGGLPGIHSARYAGNHASDSENVSKLLKMTMIRCPQNRSAQFVCSLVVFTPAGEEWTFSGKLKGKIASKPAGQLGFGYDPIFLPEIVSQSGDVSFSEKTLAELGPGFKAQCSHRAQALAEFLKKLLECQ